MYRLSAASGLTATLALSMLGALLPSALAADTCNGHAELCSRSYGNVSYVGAHNSYSVSAGSLAANQNYDVTTQLNNGVRLLQNQGHNSDGAIHLCHSSCLLLDAGPVTDYLEKVKSWLDSNPDEVVTILWVNSDSINASTWASAYEAANITDYTYTPDSYPVAYSAWPTLNELITSGKRLISFMDYDADYTECPYILDHFTHFWENPYDQTDDSFPCTIDRGTSDTPMYMINHYLDKNMSFFGSVVPVPDTSQLNQTNSASGSGSLGLNAQQCASEHGQYPTFMLVDFYDQPNGSVFQVAADLNGVEYTAVTMGNGTKISGVASSEDSSASSSEDSAASRNLGSVVLSMVAPLAVVAATLITFA